MTNRPVRSHKRGGEALISHLNIFLKYIPWVFSVLQEKTDLIVVHKYFFCGWAAPGLLGVDCKINIKHYLGVKNQNKLAENLTENG